MSYSPDCPIPHICKDIPDEYREGNQQTVYDERFLGFLVGRDNAGTQGRELGAIKKCFNCNPDCALKRMYPNSEFREDDPVAPQKPSADNFFKGS